jgi:hypothetical protein
MRNRGRRPAFTTHLITPLSIPESATTVATEMQTTETMESPRDPHPPPAPTNRATPPTWSTPHRTNANVCETPESVRIDNLEKQLALVLSSLQFAHERLDNIATEARTPTHNPVLHRSDPPELSIATPDGASLAILTAAGGGAAHADVCRDASVQLGVDPPVPRESTTPPNPEVDGCGVVDGDDGGDGDGGCDGDENPAIVI